MLYIEDENIKTSENEDYEFELDGEIIHNFFLLYQDYEFRKGLTSFKKDEPAFSFVIQGYDTEDGTISDLHFSISDNMLRGILIGEDYVITDFCNIKTFFKAVSEFTIKNKNKLEDLEEDDIDYAEELLKNFSGIGSLSVNACKKCNKGIGEHCGSCLNFQNILKAIYDSQGVGKDDV